MIRTATSLKWERPCKFLWGAGRKNCPAPFQKENLINLDFPIDRRRNSWYYVFRIRKGCRANGEMSERFKEPVLKTGDSKEPWVRIPLSPPILYFLLVRNLEKYPRGRRGSPAKGVGRDERREGSNPSFSAITAHQF